MLFSHEPLTLAQNPAVEAIIIFLITFLKEKSYLQSAHPRARIVEVKRLFALSLSCPRLTCPNPQVMSATFRSAEQENTSLSQDLFDRLATHPLSIGAMGPALMDIYIGPHLMPALVTMADGCWAR